MVVTLPMVQGAYGVWLKILAAWVQFSTMFNYEYHSVTGP